MTKAEHRKLVEDLFGQWVAFNRVYQRTSGYLNQDWRIIPVGKESLVGVVVGGRWLQNIHQEPWPYGRPKIVERIPVLLVKVSPWALPIHVPVEHYYV